MMRGMKPGDVVDTPHGRGWLLYPIRRTQRQEWIVLVGTKGHPVRADEMLGSSQDVPRKCNKAGYEVCVDEIAETSTHSQDMSTASTYQQEMML